MLDRQPGRRSVRVRAVTALLTLSTTTALAACGGPNDDVPTSPAQVLATLKIRASTTATLPADITTAFGIDGDPSLDTPIGSDCSIRWLVIAGDGHHERGMPAGECSMPTSGDWSPLVGPVVHDPATLDAGYVVPLADAWRSGAASWDSEQRNNFVFDDTLERVPIPISVEAVRGDRAPDAWQPARSDQCAYATAWINVKQWWQLTITRPEHDALAAMLITCPKPSVDSAGSESHD